MKIAVITHVPHTIKGNQYFGYAPYVREMNIWFKYADEVLVVAPLVLSELSSIETSYQHENLKFCAVKTFEVTSIFTIFKALVVLPKIAMQVAKVMAQADHIHLRCPGNMGLLGVLIQIAFPRKKKTAKYAGNWDPKSKQPWSYRLQKWILSNTFLTRNMQVLVYGEWEGSSKNIKPFFTATYSEEEIKSLQEQSRTTKNDFDTVPSDKLDNSSLSLQEQSRNSQNYKCLFVGTLSVGKQPLYAIQLVEQLQQLSKKVTLDIYGDGVLRKELENYITANKLHNIVSLKGNQTKETLKEAYQNSHFLILPSKSEGWPKAVAEAMFWGCLPVATPVSCVPYMLNYGKRGILLTMIIDKDAEALQPLVEQTGDYEQKSEAAQKWSQQFTTDLFEEEIKKLLVY